MSQRVPVAPQSLDEAVWRPSVPLAVLARCPRGQLIVVWLGLRWLRALFPRRSSFSTREIARADSAVRRQLGCPFAEQGLGRLDYLQGTNVAGHPARDPIISPCVAVDQQHLLVARQIDIDYGDTGTQHSSLLLKHFSVHLTRACHCHFPTQGRPGRALPSLVFPSSRL